MDFWDSLMSAPTAASAGFSSADPSPAPSGDAAPCISSTLAPAAPSNTSTTATTGDTMTNHQLAAFSTLTPLQQQQYLQLLVAKQNAALVQHPQQPQQLSLDTNSTANAAAALAVNQRLQQLQQIQQQQQIHEAEIQQPSPSSFFFSSPSSNDIQAMLQQQFSSQQLPQQTQFSNNGYLTYMESDDPFEPTPIAANAILGHGSLQHQPQEQRLTLASMQQARVQASYGPSSSDDVTLQSASCSDRHQQLVLAAMAKKQQLSHLMKLPPATLNALKMLKKSGHLNKDLLKQILANQPERVLQSTSQPQDSQSLQQQLLLQQQLQQLQQQQNILLQQQSQQQQQPTTEIPAAAQQQQQPQVAWDPKVLANLPNMNLNDYGRVLAMHLPGGTAAVALQEQHQQHVAAAAAGTPSTLSSNEEDAAKNTKLSNDDVDRISERLAKLVEGTGGVAKSKKNNAKRPAKKKKSADDSEKKTMAKKPPRAEGTKKKAAAAAVPPKKRRRLSATVVTPPETPMDGPTVASTASNTQDGKAAAYNHQFPPLMPATNHLQQHAAMPQQPTLGNRHKFASNPAVPPSGASIITSSQAPATAGQLYGLMQPAMANADSTWSNSDNPSPLAPNPQHVMLMFQRLQQQKAGSGRSGISDAGNSRLLQQALNQQLLQQQLQQPSQRPTMTNSEESEKELLQEFQPM